MLLCCAAPQIQVTHRQSGKTRLRLKGFTDQPAKDCTFTLKEGGNTTVAQYFEKQYKM